MIKKFLASDKVESILKDFIATIKRLETAEEMYLEEAVSKKLRAVQLTEESVKAEEEAIKAAAISIKLKELLDLAEG